MSEEYTVSVSCEFDAESPEDAVSQMVIWIEEEARRAGYRWESLKYEAPAPSWSATWSDSSEGAAIESAWVEETGFIDADSIDIMGYQEKADERAIAATLGTEEDV